MASSVAKLKQITRRKTRHGDTASGRHGEWAKRRMGARDSHQLQRNNGRASIRPPFQGEFVFALTQG
jgi:hypothetical protein